MTTSQEQKKPQYSTVEEYLEKLLYPTLKLAINDLVTEIKKPEYYADLENEFNHCFFRNKAEILQKQKQLLKLERGSDYSEGDFEYWLKQNADANESKVEKEVDKEDYDPDLDDSEVLNLEEEQLNKEEEEENKNKFDPIKFLVERLRANNKNIKGNDIDLFLNDRSEEDANPEVEKQNLEDVVENVNNN